MRVEVVVADVCALRDVQNATVPETAGLIQKVNDILDDFSDQS